MLRRATPERLSMFSDGVFEISAAREQALIEGLSESIIAPLAQQLIEHVGERLARS
jgi:hypothetical protein